MTAFATIHQKKTGMFPGFFSFQSIADALGLHAPGVIKRDREVLPVSSQNFRNYLPKCLYARTPMGRK